MSGEKKLSGEKAINGEADSPANRILEAWVRLETALRDALPVCSVQPPTQPTELLSALRINHSIGPVEEARVLALRERRNLVAHSPEEPASQEADHFEEEVAALIATFEPREESC
jgi:hypothetical protein